MSNDSFVMLEDPSNMTLDQFDREDVMVSVQDCGYLDEEKYAEIQSCTFWVEGVAMAILGFSAIITNCISIYVFSRKEMWNSFNALIVALTVADLLLCILLMADYTFARAFALHTVLYTILYPYFIYPMTNIALSASIYLTVILGLERYIAVCFPLVHRDLVHTYSVMKRVTAYTVPVILISVLINVPKFLETKIVVDMDINSSEGDDVDSFNVTTYTMDVTDLRNNPVYIKFYMNVTRTVLLGIIPFAALLYFNIKIYLRFIHTRGRYSRNNTNSTQAKDLQLALILVCVVCMFFVTNLPRLLLNLYELFNVDDMISCEDDFIPPTWFICSTSVNHLLLVLNCIMNFVVYCCFNDGFKKLICRHGSSAGLMGSPSNNNGGVSRGSSHGQELMSPFRQAGSKSSPDSLSSQREMQTALHKGHLGTSLLTDAEKLSLATTAV